MKFQNWVDWRNKYAVHKEWDGLDKILHQFNEYNIGEKW